MIKGVVDLGRGILLLEADLQADQEAALIADGSKQSNLWGINLYPDIVGDDWLAATGRGASMMPAPEPRSLRSLRGWWADDRVATR